MNFQWQTSFATRLKNKFKQQNWIKEGGKWKFQTVQTRWHWLENVWIGTDNAAISLNFKLNLPTFETTTQCTEFRTSLASASRCGTRRENTVWISQKTKCSFKQRQSSKFKFATTKERSTRLKTCLNNNVWTTSFKFKQERNTQFEAVQRSGSFGWLTGGQPVFFILFFRF